MKFIQTVKAYYKKNGRSFPWRETRDPYAILVSEFMLQQTQTSRVLQKYPAFLREFPTVEKLAKAPLQKVLTLWQGLGYNRRALNLKKTAELIHQIYQNNVPETSEELKKLPGVGAYTAAAICTFAFDQPHVLIETNIRAVYLHHFFPTHTQVHDKELLALIERTLDKKDPRTWYYALMDYGVMLKSQHKNPARKSAHHRPQTPFENSNRQLRGLILKSLTDEPSSLSHLARMHRAFPREKITQSLDILEKEGFITRAPDGSYMIKE